VLELRDALALRVRVGQGTGPLWGFLVVGALVAVGSVAIYAAVTSATLTRSTMGVATDSTPASAAASASAATSPPPPPSESSSRPAPAPKSALERAASGDEAALRELEAKPEAKRSVGEVLAIARGHATVKQHAVSELLERARHDEAFAASGELSSKLRSALADPDTVNEALRVAAELPSTLGGDLLYAIWASHKKGDAVRDLADALLASAAVRKRASLPLSVALDLRRAESCDSAKDAVHRAVDQGDWRAAHALGRFAAKRGCGENKKDDCWPCLRDDDTLKRAMKAVVKRPAPKL
jgi:hypothetical protein